MRLLHIAPYVGLLLIGQTALDAAPLAVAAQEGGMGPGSALIVAYVLQAGGIVLGAAAAAYLVDRGTTPTALLAGAVLFAGGVIVAMTAPMGSLGWVIVGVGVAGSGFGLILTVAFAAAAGVGGPHRPFAIMLLLLAPLAGRIAASAIVLAGPLLLIGAAAVVVGISVLLARSSGLASRGSVGPAAITEESASHRLPGGAALLGGLLLAAGVAATLAGVDTTGVSAFAFVGFLGASGVDVLDGARIALTVSGLVMVVGGSLLLFRRLGPDSRLPWAGPVIGLAGFTAAGMGTGFTLAVTLGGSPSGREAAALAGLAGVGGTAAGLVLGGWWLARRGAPRVVAIAGSLVLVGASALGLVALSGAGSLPADAFVPAIVLGLGGLGGALVAVALRLILAQSAVQQRGLAAGAGVVAAWFGWGLGSLVGTGAATRWLTGDPNEIPTGAVVLAAAAVAAVVATLLMPSHRPAGT